MNSHSSTRLVCSVGHSIFYSTAKVILIIFVLTGIFGIQTAVAVDFKTYLQGARSEITHNQGIIREDPLDAIAYFELGRSYLALGKHEEEVEAYKEAIQLYPNYIAAHYNLAKAFDEIPDKLGIPKLVVSRQLRRLAILVHKCLRNKEPVLLVGETGCGKTTLCQVFAALNN